MPVEGRAAGILTAPVHHFVEAAAQAEREHRDIDLVRILLSYWALREIERGMAAV